MSTLISTNRQIPAVRFRSGPCCNPEWVLSKVNAMDMDLATRLWTWRTHRGLSLQQVADRSGVGIHMLNKAECGKRDLGFARVRRVVERAFETTLPKFCGTLPKVRVPIGLAGRPRSSSRPLTGSRAA